MKSSIDLRSIVSSSFMARQVRENLRWCGLGCCQDWLDNFSAPQSLGTLSAFDRRGGRFGTLRENSLSWTDAVMMCRISTKSSVRSIDAMLRFQAFFAL